MTVQRMEHVGIVVDDLAAATAFFVELGSPYAYLVTRRIERAMTLLRRGDLTVTDVCYAVGCSSLGLSIACRGHDVDQPGSSDDDRVHAPVAKCPLDGRVAECSLAQGVFWDARR